MKKSLILLDYYVIILKYDCKMICVEAGGCGIYVGFSVEYVRF